MNSWKELFTALKKDPSLQTQAVIRKKLYMSKGFKKEKLSKDLKRRFLKQILDVKQDDAITVAAFRSHLISHLVPNFTKVIGLVQHDQYHRYSVDSHILQAVRGVKRFYEFPKLLGRLEFYSEKLKLSDWNILRWTALYHDMAKGQTGPHEKVGRDYVVKDLRALGLSKEMINEVAWLVENHLILSTAAFRKNPNRHKLGRLYLPAGCEESACTDWQFSRQWTSLPQIPTLGTLGKKACWMIWSGP